MDNGLYIIFILLSLGLAAGFGAFWVQKRGLDWKGMGALLAISAVLTGFGITETFLMGIEKLRRDPVSPGPPAFLIKRDAGPHHLVQNSILYIELPNSEFRTVGHIYQTNRFGFRERNFPLKKSPGIFRILAFGDSFTFGTGVANEHRYTNMLEDMLNIVAGEKRFEVLNFGMPGYAVDQERDLIEAVLNHIEADLVVLGVCCDDLNMTTRSSIDGFTSSAVIGFGDSREGTDIYSNPSRNYSTLPVNAPPDHFKSMLWRQKTRLFKFLAVRTNIDRDRLIPSPGRWEFALNEYRNILLAVKKRGLPSPIALLLYFGSIRPGENDFIKPKGRIGQYNRLYEFLGEKLRIEGFRIANPLKLFQEHSGMAMAVSEWEKHPNFLSHYLYARALLNLIGSPEMGLRKWLEPAAGPERKNPMIDKNSE